MSYKTILVYVDPRQDSQQRLQAAASIAMQFDATIVGGAAALLRPLTDPYGDPLIGSSIGSERKTREQRIAAELETCESVFRTWAVAAGVPCEWRAEPQLVVDLIVAARATF